MTSRAPDAAAARPGRACPHPSSRTRAPGLGSCLPDAEEERGEVLGALPGGSALVASLDEVGGGGVGPGAADERAAAPLDALDEGAIEDGDGLGGPSGGRVGNRRGVQLGRGDERVGGRGDVGGAAPRRRARARVRVRVAAEVEAEARTLAVAVAAPHGRGQARREVTRAMAPGDAQGTHSRARERRRRRVVLRGIRARSDSLLVVTGNPHEMFARYAVGRRHAGFRFRAVNSSTLRMSSPVRVAELRGAATEDPQG